MSKSSKKDAGDTCLRAYISEVQSKACQLRGLMQAIVLLENTSGCDSAKSALIMLGEDLSAEINIAPETVSLPEVAS